MVNNYRHPEHLALTQFLKDQGLHGSQVRAGWELTEPHWLSQRAYNTELRPGDPQVAKAFQRAFNNSPRFEQHVRDSFAVIKNPDTILRFFTSNTGLLHLAHSNTEGLYDVAGTGYVLPVNPLLADIQIWFLAIKSYAARWLASRQYVHFDREEALATLVMLLIVLGSGRPTPLTACFNDHDLLSWLEAKIQPLIILTAFAGLLDGGAQISLAEAKKLNNLPAVTAMTYIGT